MFRLFFGNRASGGVNNYNETGLALTLLLTQGKIDEADFINNVGQTLLFIQAKVDALAALETSRPQTLLFNQNRTDALAGLETRSQTILFSQARTDSLGFLETGRSQSILFQSNIQNQSWVGSESLTQTIRFTQVGGDISSFSENIGTTILFSQAATDTVPDVYGTFVATTSVRGFRPNQGISIRGGT